MYLELSQTLIRNVTFATGGAGVCISRGLADLLEPYVADGKSANLLKTVANAGDDGIMGYLITAVLKVPLTEKYSNLLHSHWHKSDVFRIEELSNQVTLSHPININISENSPGVNVYFGLEEDPTRFLTIHCFIHPDTDYCHQQRTQSVKTG